MELRYFDAHTHIQDQKFDADREEVITRMRERGVGGLIIGTDQDMSDRAVQTAKNHENLWVVIGQHPTDKKSEVFNDSFYRNLIESDRITGTPKIVGIGECGLDYFRGDPTPAEKKRQKEVFEAQIELAAFYNLPLMIHCRDAHDDCLEILRRTQRQHGDRIRGNVHFFTGSSSVAQQYFNLGFTASFTGVLTFTTDYDDVVRYAPLDRILSETDCPYVAPVPYRGSRNEPSYVVEVVKAIARIRGEEEGKVAAALMTNTRRVFRI